MAESLAKIGRGGAGNYWSKKDLDEAAKARPADEDIEAQNHDPARLTRTTTSQQTEYSKIGRGGAGNVVYTPEAEAAGSELARVATSRTVNGAASGAKKGPQVYQGHGGRGGAGNWRGNFEEEKREREAEEERAKRGVEKRVNEEVLLSLKAPESAYRGPGEKS